MISAAASYRSATPADALPVSRGATPKGAGFLASSISLELRAGFGSSAFS